MHFRHSCLTRSSTVEQMQQCVCHSWNNLGEVDADLTQIIVIPPLIMCKDCFASVCN